LPKEKVFIVSLGEKSPLSKQGWGKKPRQGRKKIPSPHSPQEATVGFSEHWPTHHWSDGEVNLAFIIPTIPLSRTLKQSITTHPRSISNAEVAN
jgi:hypothetical protein